MKSKEIVKALEPWMKRVRRPAWKPILEEGDGLPTESKFFGTPWTGSKAPWPECATCKVPMALVLQLRLGELPEGPRERHGKGLLQFFYCERGSDCRAKLRAMPFRSFANCVRIVRPVPQGKGTPAPRGHEPLPAHRIVGWTPFDDLPGPQEQDENGLKSTYDFEASTIRLECPELGFDVTSLMGDCTIEDIAESTSGDKLAGWPRWVQGVEYPFCPQCGRRMILIFQLAAHDHANYALGDFGTGHITQCSEHKDVMAFGYAR
jgi:uncharacterized protein YwqG